MKSIKVTVAGCNTFECYLKHSVDQEIAKLKREKLLLGYKLGNALDRLRRSDETGDKNE